MLETRDSIRSRVYEIVILALTNIFTFTYWSLRRPSSRVVSVRLAVPACIYTCWLKSIQGRKRIGRESVTLLFVVRSLQSWCQIERHAEFYLVYV